MALYDATGDKLPSGDETGSAPERAVDLWDRLCKVMGVTSALMVFERHGVDPDALQLGGFFSGGPAAAFGLAAYAQKHVDVLMHRGGGQGPR